MGIKVQNSFVSGEFNPELYARADADPYQTGVAYCNNFLCSDKGPLIRRPPTYRFGEVWNQALTYRTELFALSEAEQYLLVFASDGKMRIIDIANREWVESSPGTPYELDWGSLMNSSAKIADFDAAQNGKLMVFVRADMAPQALVFNSKTSWIVSQYTLLDGPFEELSQSRPGMWSNVTAANGTNILYTTAATFDGARDVGRQIRYGLADLSEWVQGVIASVTSSTQATVTWQYASQGGGINIATATPGRTSWRWGIFHPNNYPTKVAFFEDRLCLAAPPSNPEAVYLSTTSGFNLSTAYFSPTTVSNNSISDGEGISRSAGSGSRGAGEIQWLLPLKDLFIGSSSGVYSLGTRQGAGAFGPLTASFSTLSSTRASDASPRDNGGNLLFVESGGRRPLRLDASVARVDRAYTVDDVSFFSGHLFYTDTVADTFRLEYPYSSVWFRMESGKFLKMLYQNEDDNQRPLVGLFRQELGGALGNGTAKCVDATEVYSTASQSEEVWMFVERTIGGNTTLQIEYLVAQTALIDTDMVHLDHQDTPTWTGTTPATVAHFAGQTIRCVIDGADFGEFTVDSSGDFTLPTEPETSLVIGYGYVSELWTLPPVQPSDDTGLAVVGQPIEIKNAELTLLKSVGVEVGRVSLGETIPQAEYVSDRRKTFTGTTNSFERPPLFSGTWKAASTAGGGATVSPALAFRTRTSYPLNILSIRQEYHPSWK